jgi:hypothetical protein
MRPSIGEVLSDSEVVVVANGSPAFRPVPETIRRDQILIDLVGIADRNGRCRSVYAGICW